MNPVIFALSVNKPGNYTKTASSLLIMGIVGGAVVPPMMGYMSDTGGVRCAFIAPMICYLYVVYYGFKGVVIRYENIANQKLVL